MATVNIQNIKESIVQPIQGSVSERIRFVIGGHSLNNKIYAVDNLECMPVSERNNRTCKLLIGETKIKKYNNVNILEII